MRDNMKEQMDHRQQKKQLGCIKSEEVVQEKLSLGATTHVWYSRKLYNECLQEYDTEMLRQLCLN